ncbi:MAG: energy-coupling factor transporter ATPase [Clostridia bacterium]|nr:energy-coupling factor transporter ATPase [Clostridia bacterium]MBQ1554687.1 energy-coupling factor transporter ATPase [Clostridia bacterium]
MALIETQDLRFVYGKGTPFEKEALKGATLAINQGEFIGVIGHTGSGKSTLVQMLNGLLKPDAGKVFLNGTDIWAKPKEIRKVRFEVGLVFQYPEYQLFEETVYKDIAFGPTNKGITDKDELDGIVRRAAEFAGLKESLLEKSPFDLSGGEKRRAAIAGVIAMEPKVLILDEPTAGLDPKGRDRILNQIRKYREQTGSTVLLVSHSMEDIARVADRVLVMNHGNVEMFDTTEKVFQQGEHLAEIGLKVPQVTQIFLELKKLGADVDTGVYTMEQAKAGVLSYLRGSETEGGSEA